MSQITNTAVNFAGTDEDGNMCFGNGWEWKSSAAGTDGDVKLGSRGRMGMDTVYVVTDRDGMG